jgi:hypothetical protein
MYAEIIERKILTDINEKTRWWITDEGFLIMPENDEEMKDLIELVEKYHPDPDASMCKECQDAVEREEKKYFDPNIG